MQFQLGILVNLGSCKKVEVVITSPGASFEVPAQVFILGGPPAVVDVRKAGVTFADLNQNLIRVLPVLDCPATKCSFRVTYSPSGADNPAIFIWNFADDRDPPANSAVWDHDAEQIVHLA
jgi:hypothetical protein